MRIAVVTRPRDPISLRIYQQNVTSELEKVGVTLVRVSENGSIPNRCDLIWDPGLGMRRIPDVLRTADIPVVVTVHGVRVFSIPEKELHSRERRMKQLLIDDWKSFKEKVDAIVTVSKYGAEEVCSAFDITPDKVCPIYHGVNQQIFHPNGEKPIQKTPYFLHVAQYQPLKNSPRLFVAYSKLPVSKRPNLMAILPGFSEDITRWKIPGLHIITKEILPLELAKWYRGALGFMFPSIRETFGLPILEAMACGCPVLTSNQTGCAEISGDAALKVNPKSISEMQKEMKRLIEETQLREQLATKGINHAARFSWKKSGEEHLKLFKKVIINSSKYM
ncbi:hypothetical protein BKP37_17845 [Anaerobacillus alkalilacustris]|uniref:Glycosyl transferase family 1 n=1 Tax=Anaerobacillus alkalilacustris TaxID=393763 RepID=A0A1S2LDJ2_9BACI|nr:glycosyltransferase family 1 protein [Anaerobacillus alkalilacustris]OIJ10404.1 hypothetical protein BKP37_17845 [Anaerobacillus alkalilacustris]